jgi:ketosteroid isomerase-like protein
MTPQQAADTQAVADTLIRLCSQSKFEEAGKTLYAPDVVSVEAFAPPGQSRETKGKEAVLAKGKQFLDSHEVHSCKVEGPIIAGSYFAVTMKIEATNKPSKQRFQMEEIALYKVENGKIAREEFFYSM